VTSGRSPDYSLKGDQSRKDEHDDADEGNAKEDIVHSAVIPYYRHGQYVDGDIRIIVEQRRIVSPDEIL
jgi:hypothetical protein